MGAMEPSSSGEGYETDSSSNKVEDMLANTLRRAASVDDLFVSLWGLNVHASAADSHRSSSSTGARPSDPSSVQNPCASSVIADSSLSQATPDTIHIAAPTPGRTACSSGQSCAPSANLDRKGVPDVLSASQPLTGHDPSAASGADRTCSREAKVHSVSEVSQQTGSERAVETAGGTRGSSSSRSSSQLSDIEGADVKPSFCSVDPEPFPAFRGRARGTGNSNSGGGAEAALPPSQSTSDDDQGGLDERKQKRMLSNRESARRSRLRKQQHLDELRAQVTQLRAENSNILAKFSIASHRYSQLTRENLVLRAHAEDLSRKLQRLHLTVATQHPNGLRALGIQTEDLDPVSLGNYSSNHLHLSPYSQA